MKKLLLMLIILMSAAGCLFAQTNTSITLKNETGYTINEIYFSPSAFDDWDDNFIPEGGFSDGDEISIVLDRDIDQGETVYDLQAVDEDNDYYTMYEIDLSESPIVSITMDAYDGGDYSDYDSEYSGYEEGYNEGFSEGYKQGYIDAFRDAYLEGFKAGQETDVPMMPEKSNGFNSSGDWR